MRLHSVASVVSVVKPFCVLRLRRAELHEPLFRGWRRPRPYGISAPLPGSGPIEESREGFFTAPQRASTRPRNPVAILRALADYRGSHLLAELFPEHPRGPIL
jgi:hypothetical protein